MIKSESSNNLLGPVQKRFVASALTFLAVVLLGGLSYLLFAILQKFVTFFSGVIWPLAIAGILTLLLRPVVLFFEKRLKLNRVKSIVLLYALVILVCCAMLAWFIPILIQQIIDLTIWAPQLVDNVRSFLEQHFPQYVGYFQDNLTWESVRGYIDKILAALGNVWAVSIPAIREAGEWIAKVLTWSTAVAIVPIYLFFFLSSDNDPTRDLDSQLSFLKPKLRYDILFLVREFASILVAFFRGQIVIGLIMGVMLAIGFTAAGLRFGLILGLLIGLLNIIPYLGTILGLGTVLPIAYFQPEGGLTTLAVCLGVFFLVQIIEGYLLTPRIMGKQTGLHPVAVIISIFFWGAALNGLLGMVLAIPLTAFFIVAWRLVKKNYLTPLLSDDEDNSGNDSDDSTASPEPA